ncbi:hypothetical protein HYS94_03360 [Candidatus Daviesbacteria bacterium]|nr:hypothetical protein [Candidatus Daviesbacteria bacterium]
MAIITDKKLLALALERKANPRYSSETKFRYKGYEYDFEKEIFPSARYQFQKYNLAYRDNQDFAEAFTRDLYRKNSELITEINKGAKTPEEQIFYEEPTASAEGIPSGQAETLPPSPPAEAAGAAGGIPPMPGGSFGVPRIVHTVPRAPQPPPEETAPSKLAVANRSGVAVGERVVKNLGSSTGIGIKKFGSRLGGGLGGVLGGVGNGGFRFIGGIGDVLSRFPNSPGVNWAKTSSKKVVWGIILAFLALLFLTGFSVPLTSTEESEAGVTPVTNISNCKFTRSGTSLPIKSTTLQGWIVAAGNNAGAAPAVLASIAMHESANFVANADDNHDAIKSNQYCQKAKSFCELNGQVLHSNPEKDDPCTAEEIARGARTAQAVGLMQLLDIYNQGKGDLCSITNSLAIAAEKLKANGITQQPTQDQVNTAIRLYYNSCNYGSYSYCNEVWQDYQNCQVTSSGYNPGGGNGIVSCPLNGGIVTLGSKDTPGGHCSAEYQQKYPCASPDVTGRSTAVDLQSSDKTVFLPYLNGEQVTWTIIESGTPISTNEGGGFALSAKTKNYTIRFVHITPILRVGQTAQSATPVGQYLADTDHVHVTIQEDGVFKPADLYFNLCK